MKRISILLLGILLCTAIAATSGTAFAVTGPTWVSNNYTLTTMDNGVKASGEAAYGSKCSLDRKVDMDGFAVTLDFQFDYDNFSFDWMALIFSPSEAPYLSSGAAVSLLLRPRGSELVCSIMNSNLTEIVSLTTSRSEDDVYSVSVALADSSLEFTVNGTKVSSESSSINYAILGRGVYCSVGVNAAADDQSATFELELKNDNIIEHDSSQDEIHYGAWITVNDESIADLISDNCKIVQQDEGSGSGCNSMIAFGNFGIVLTFAAALMLHRKK